MEACLEENAGKTFWYLAPSRAQAKNIVWMDPKMLFNFIPPGIIKKKRF